MPEGLVKSADLQGKQLLGMKSVKLGVIREAYLDLSHGPLDLRIGKQIIAWGRADRINPTDNLTPRDYTLLVPDDDDQRLGTPAVKATSRGARPSPATSSATTTPPSRR